MARMAAERTFHGRRRYTGTNTLRKNQLWSPGGRAGMRLPYLAAIVSSAAIIRFFSALVRSQAAKRGISR
jgi:hypothetical protein